MKRRSTAMLGVQRIAGIIGFSAGLTILPLVAIAAGYDGTYAGQVTLVRGDQSICGKSPLPVTKQVVNGHFDLVYDPAHHVGVNLEVQQDGSFSGDQAYMVGSQRQQVRASGRVAGNVLQAHIEGLACSRDYNLTKQ
jgi:hypothetical protein